MDQLLRYFAGIAVGFFTVDQDPRGVVPSFGLAARDQRRRVTSSIRRDGANQVTVVTSSAARELVGDAAAPVIPRRTFEA